MLVCRRIGPTPSSVRLWLALWVRLCVPGSFRLDSEDMPGCAHVHDQACGHKPRQEGLGLGTGGAVGIQAKLLRGGAGPGGKGGTGPQQGADAGARMPEHPGPRAPE